MLIMLQTLLVRVIVSDCYLQYPQRDILLRNSTITTCSVSWPLILKNVMLWSYKNNIHKRSYYLLLYRVVTPQLNTSVKI